MAKSVQDFLLSEEEEDDMFSWNMRPDRDVTLIRPTGRLYRDTFLFRYTAKASKEETFAFTMRMPRTQEYVDQVVAFLLQKQPKHYPPWWQQITTFETTFTRNVYEDVVIEGCKNATLLRNVSDKYNKYVLIIGEDHHKDGNFVSFLQDVLDNTSCPIDIVIEKEERRSVAKYEGKQVFSHHYWRSHKSHLYHVKQELGTCTSGCEEPYTDTFLQECILPFQGRVRFWSEDIRFTPSFIFLQFLSVHIDEDTWHLQTQYRQQFYDLLTDTDLYHDNRQEYLRRMDRYLEDVRDLVNKVFERVEFQEEPIRRKWRDFFEGLPKETMEEWVDILRHQTNEYHEHYGPLFDLPACHRILKLLQEPCHRIILVFTGSAHVTHIARMLAGAGVPSVRTYRNHPSKISIPRVSVSTPTEWMRLYTEKLNKVG